MRESGRKSWVTKPKTDRRTLPVTDVEESVDAQLSRARRLLRAASDAFIAVAKAPGLTDAEARTVDAHYAAERKRVVEVLRIFTRRLPAGVCLVPPINVGAGADAQRVEP